MKEKNEELEEKAAVPWGIEKILKDREKENQELREMVRVGEIKMTEAEVKVKELEEKATTTSSSTLDLKKNIQDREKENKELQEKVIIMHAEMKESEAKINELKEKIITATASDNTGGLQDKKNQGPEDKAQKLKRLRIDMSSCKHRKHANFLVTLPSAWSTWYHIAAINASHEAILHECGVRLEYGKMYAIFHHWLFWARLMVICTTEQDGSESPHAFERSHLHDFFRSQDSSDDHEADERGRIELGSTGIRVIDAEPPEVDLGLAGVL